MEKLLLKLFSPRGYMNDDGEWEVESQTTYSGKTKFTSMEVRTEGGWFSPVYFIGIRVKSKHGNIIALVWRIFMYLNNQKKH